MKKPPSFSLVRALTAAVLIHFDGPAPQQYLRKVHSAGSWPIEVRRPNGTSVSIQKADKVAPRLGRPSWLALPAHA